MWNSNLVKFLNRVSKDKELMAEFQKNKTFEDLYSFALNHSEGYFSKKEFQEAVDAIEVFAKKYKKGELSEDELNNIAGGGAPETSLRSCVMLFQSLVQLVLGASNFYLSNQEFHARVENDEYKAKYESLIKQMEQLQAAKGEKMPTIPGAK
jgi:hypothetical protein